MRNVYEVPRQKELEVSRLEKEVEALRIPTPLLSESEEAENENASRLASIAVNTAPQPGRDRFRNASRTLTWPYVPPARICSRLRSRRRRPLLLRPHPDHHRHVLRINHITTSGEEVGIHRHGSSIEAKSRSHDPGVRESSHDRA